MRVNNFVSPSLLDRLLYAVFIYIINLIKSNDLTSMQTFYLMPLNSHIYNEIDLSNIMGLR